MTNLNIPAPPSGQRPVDTYQWLGKILEVLGTTKGISWYDNNALNIKQLGDAIGNDINFSKTVDKKIADSHLPVQIPAYCDLDTYTETGLYTSDSDGNSATITNRPPGTQGFILQVYTVWGSTESNRVIQISYMRSDAMIYTRSKDESGNNWSEWVSYIRSTDVTPNNTGNKVVQRDSSGNFTAGTITATLSGNAKTATTLQTTRNINGTPFNGSGDITTANWGTSRNITIGNSTKPVNGSTNVTWTLSEIGAANASHTHTSSQISDATNANTANMIVKRDGSGNFSAGTISASLNGTASYANYMNSNTRMEYGWNGVNYFNISGTAGNAAKVNDTPTTAWWHIMRFNHANSAGFYTDLAVPFNDVSLHYKRVNSGAVQNGGWIKVLDSLNYTSFVPTKTGSGASGTWGISVSGNASTATTLQTARTINGTSFNGSANITTANWGTARNITIGNTTRSVNGSTNVSWTLADIGAAAASHTHSYLPLSGGTMTGAITSSLTTTTHIDGNKGKAIINSTASGASYTMLAKMNSTNGYWTLGNWTTKFILTYTAKSIVDAGTNNVSKEAVLLDESGNSIFPGTVNAPAFSGSLSGNATTATKLQTDRTINGTSFNGSANITTANWGTARTITIGSTGKSVNGSGNVSWTLAEMGAFGKQGEVTVSTNWNTLLTPGVYKVQMSAWGATSLGGPNNLISGLYSYGMVFVYQSNVANETRTVQTYYPHRSDNSSPILTRMYNSSSWTSWSKIGRGLTYSDVGAAAASHTHNYAGSSSAGGAANSATQLATARTINGTSFNGSANITTANWGTARTLTIGNSGKSVNGSGNVSWSLAEMGAVPVSTGSAITIHADSDASSTGEYLLLKAGHNELKIASSAGGGTVTKSNTNLTYNGNQVYHAGNKPTAAAIGAAAASHTHSYLPLSGGTITGSLTTSYLKVGGNLDLSAYLTIKHNTSIRSYNTDNSTIRHLVWIAPDNKTRIGDERSSVVVSHSLESLGPISSSSTITGVDIKANNFIPVGPNLHLRGSGTNYDQGTIVLFTSPRPATNGGQILGSTNYRFGSVWCTQGVFNGSDSKLKENIKLINKKVYTSNLYNDNVTMEELYTYIKESNLYTYNFKKSTENVVGILADELPDNIFNKIGVISKTEEEYIEEVEQQKRCIELLNTPRTLNLTDEDVVEEVGITYEEFKEVINKEIEEPVRLINAPAQVAMIQGVLGMALNKLEYAENEISDLRSEVAELKALVNQLISK